MFRIDTVLTDRGSRYAVSGGPAASRAEVQAFLRALTRDKRYARATHNSWGALLPDGPAKGDDGETGAGAIILRMLEAAGRRSEVVVVTRWYGGTHLGGDRFRHVQDCVRRYLAESPPAGTAPD
ncbi:YigZ family protein [Halodurantibacterium flavum]|uniref:YigZ family protein n=1 Tax=Halodurantibacterium flavum TaxID=1382802 RepID=A0ABW4S1G2_9RHOB